MAIPSYDFINKPYKDSMLDYNYYTHRYIPTIEGVRNTAYINLVEVWRTQENAQSYLDLLSSVVYDVILSNIDGSKYRTKALYYLAHSKEMRNLLIDLFKDSVWYNQRDGGFMMAYNSGVNLNQGKFVEFGIDKALSVIAQQKLKNSDLGNRVLKYNLNKFNYFDDLDELKVFLVDNDYLDQNEADKIEKFKQIPKHKDYDIRLQNDSGKIVYEDFKTYEKDIIGKMWLYDKTNGSW